MLTRAVGTASLVAAASVWLWASPAHADFSGSGWSNGPDIGAQASGGTGNGGSSGGSGGGGPPKCTSVPTTYPAGVNPSSVGLGPALGGHLFSVTCIDDQGNATTRVVWRPDGPGAAAPVDPVALAQQALHSVTLPLPDVRTSPDASNGTVVNFPTWLWVDGNGWSPQSASASAGPVTVTTTAVPVSVTWDMGNGETISCDGPGTPYDLGRPSASQQSNCTYVYRLGSAGQPDHSFKVTATVTWHATWQASGVAGGGDLGTITRSSSIGLPVGEVQALNTSAGG